MNTGGVRMYAIIATGGKQYKVSEGDTIRVEKLSATVVENGKGKKVIVYRYKRKSGYHKKNGHRQAYTKVKIDKIEA